MSLVLRRAIEAARQALLHLEAKQVPAALRPVVKASGLTPHLEALLVRELEAQPWLREKAADQWGDAAAALAGDGPDRASAFFLLRPEGWGEQIVRIAGEMGWTGGAAAGDRAGVALEKARAETAEAKDKARALNRQLTEARNELRRAAKAAAEPTRTEQTEVARLKAQHASSAAAARLHHAELEAALQSASAEVSRLKEELRREHLARTRAERKVDEAQVTPGWSKGGIELARLLDQVSAAAIRVIPDDEPAAGTDPPRLPKGVRPDSAEAVDHILKHPGPKHIVVDGYNVGLALAAGKAADVRSRLDPVLVRLRTLARPPRSVAVVYDSGIEGSRTGGAAGVMVHFAPPGVTADDLIVKMAATAGTVVISNDREVRERAERIGALALWAEALVAWVRKRR
jgi:hypothetical protein